MPSRRGALIYRVQASKGETAACVKSRPAGQLANAGLIAVPAGREVAMHLPPGAVACVAATGASKAELVWHVHTEIQELAIIPRTPQDWAAQ